MRIKCALIFQSTSLSRGKTHLIRNWGARCRLSIHFPLTREDRQRRACEHSDDLSIHFPLTREDPYPGRRKDMVLSFNPLPSHEGRHKRRRPDLNRIPFNPLPSHEGRPLQTLQHRSSGSTFNPLPSHEGRPLIRDACLNAVSFQSTSLSRGKTLETFFL